MKVKLYYFVSIYSSEGKLEVSLCDYRTVDCLMKNRIYLDEKEIEIPDCELPSKQEICAGIVTNLRKEKAEIQAETHLKVSAIDEKINQLLCLEAK